MSWKDLPKEKWRPCTICGHIIKKQYMPSSLAGAIRAADQDIGCENNTTLWHRTLVTKRDLLWSWQEDGHPKKFIKELQKEIAKLKKKIPKPVT